MKKKAVIHLKLPSEKYAETLLSALEPEIKAQLTVRSKASLARRESILVLKIDAKDTVALRAALNSYLRWIGSITNVLEALERQ